MCEDTKEYERYMQSACMHKANGKDIRIFINHEGNIYRYCPACGYKKYITKAIGGNNYGKKNNY